MKKYLIIILSLSMLLAVACSSGNNTVSSENKGESTDVEANTSSNDTTLAETQSEDAQVDQTDEEIPTIMAPDFSLEDLDGNTVNLSDYLGKKVIINFWTTWCPYCVDEMPDFAKLQEKYPDDLEILFVDVAESKDDVQAFIDENNIEGTVLLDTDGQVSYLYGVNSFPTTLAVNPEGEVVTGWIGLMSLELMEQMYGLIK